MKKILFSLIAMFLLVGCSSGTSYREVTYNQFANKIKEKKTFVIFVGSAQCSHCDEFKPTLTRVIDDFDLDVDYIDVSKVSQSQYNEMKKKIGLEGTPTLSFIEEGNCDTSKNLIGNSSYENTVEFFEKNGFIK